MLWSSLATGDASLASMALEALPPTPRSAGWVNYVRCHDDIGWAVSDADAAAAGLNGAAHRAFLARVLPWRLLAVVRRRRRRSPATPSTVTSARAAPPQRCAAWVARCGRGSSSAIDTAVRRLELLYGVMFGFPGVPLVYMGDELALDNDPTTPRCRRRPTTRVGCTDRRCRGTGRRRNVAGTITYRMFSYLQALARVRNEQPAMDAGGDLVVHRHPDTAVFAWARHHPRHGRFYGLANFAHRGWPACRPTRWQRRVSREPVPCSAPTPCTSTMQTAFRSTPTRGVVRRRRRRRRAAAGVIAVPHRPHPSSAARVARVAPDAAG